jgi:hypothetical protein
MPDTSNLQNTTAGNALLAALPALLSKSDLLNYLWTKFNGPVVIGAPGHGTYYDGTTPNIDPQMLPGGQRELTYAQLTTVIDHEPTHTVSLLQFPVRPILLPRS